MNFRARLLAASVALLALAGSQLSAGADASGGAGSAGSPDRAALAVARLSADATGGLTVARDARGVVDFVGVRAGARLDNPAVTAATGALDAARAHLARYGSAFGADRQGTTLTAGRVSHTVSGQDVVRFTQRVGGVPVIGGEIVMNLRPNRQVGSILAGLSASRSVAEPRLSSRPARRQARAAAAKAMRVAPSTLRLADAGRWLFDPAVFGARSALGARSVWRYEISRGSGVRRLVLVDDQTGAIALNIDQIQKIDRVVCDRANVRGNATLCTSGFARTEASGPSGVAEVNAAFDLAGAVSTYYEQIGGLDLTEALGIDVGGVKKLAATVRFCYPLSTGAGCPYANAFWNGQQMFYGDTYAGADDVVGHEMTHGVIDQYSELFYWYQSGAINESIADIMGEIVDHRHASAGDSATDWRLGEDLPIGAIRDLKTPGNFGQPDRMTSGLYTADLGFGDNGGVHTNSGVGNKTAYLISQGGTFNGQTITGIDVGDANLTKTGKLYLDVIQSLTSGSDYADLARVLDQSCQDLLAAGTSGFTAANCTNVHNAGLATQLDHHATERLDPAGRLGRLPHGHQQDRPVRQRDRDADLQDGPRRQLGPGP